LPAAEDHFEEFLDDMLDKPEPTKLATHLAVVHQAWVDALQLKRDKRRQTLVIGVL